MINSVHIIHPYTYKIKGEELIIGPVKEYSERDKRIKNFAGKALKSGARVFHHADLPVQSMDGLIRNALFALDPLFEWLRDSRIQIFTTTRYGMPIKDNKPDNLNTTDWEQLKLYYTSSADMKKLASKSDKTFFIGGVLECCVSNAISHYQDRIMGSSEEVFYVPELCVSLNPEKFKPLETKLSAFNIFALSYKEAMLSMQN